MTTGEPQANGARVVQRATVEIRKLRGELVRLLQGEISNDEFRPRRTPLGVYGQRQPQQYMVRVRIPGGVLKVAQLHRLAELSQEVGDGTGHLTTRQNMQLHNLKLEQTPELLERLLEVGLTTLQVGGNSVRNVTACPLAGICQQEAFNVTPYATLVNHYFTGHPLVQQLPRKFKMGFSGCATDCAFTGIQDFGAVATTSQVNGEVRRGFQVFAAGGLGSIPTLAQPLEEFLPEEELLPTCEAIIRLFDRLGDRTSKNRARLKFVMRRVGPAEFRRLVQEERAAIRREGRAFPPLPQEVPQTPPSMAQPPATEEPDAGALARWRSANVVPQRQPGYAAIRLPLPLGNITSPQMERLAQLAEELGVPVLRTSPEQNLVLPWVPEQALPYVYGVLDALGLTDTRAEGIADITSCPGAAACSLGITAPRGLAKALAAMVQEERYQEDEALAGLRIRVSGCPDSCSLHHLASIGLYGGALHQDSRLYPAYHVLLGGHVAAGATRLAQQVIKLPARRVPEGVRRIVTFYREQREPHEEFPQFLDRVGAAAVRDLLADLTVVPPPRENIWNFIDWDSTRMYILERGEGECAV